MYTSPPRTVSRGYKLMNRTGANQTLEKKGNGSPCPNLPPPVKRRLNMKRRALTRRGTSNKGKILPWLGVWGWAPENSLVLQKTEKD